MTVAEASEKYGINKQTLKSRMFARKISMEDAIFNYVNPKSPIKNGTKFGHLVVIGRVKGKRNGKYRCKCDCGNVVIKFGLVLKKKTKSKKSCNKPGCVYSLTKRHGYAKRKQGKRNMAYNCWLSIKQRCFNEANPSYPYYGGRGITMSDMFVNDFKAFLKEIGERPSMNYTVDRIDNDKGYFPGNIRWATKKEQMRNVRKVNDLSSRIELLERKCIKHGISI